MKRHKKPSSPRPSIHLTQFAKEIAFNPIGPIVDVACGYGRNAIHVSSFGVPVTCVDNDKQALAHITSLSSSLPPQANLTALHLDVINDPWPFEEESLGAILNVHFFRPELLGNFVNSLRVGGYLFIETIDGHGANYLELPPLGFIKDNLRDIFDIKLYKEKKVGPPETNAASVKVFACKIKTAKE